MLIVGTKKSSSDNNQSKGEKQYIIFNLYYRIKMKKLSNFSHKIYLNNFSIKLSKWKRIYIYVHLYACMLQ